MTIHISNHPCLQAKLSQLRSHTTTTRETRELVTEISTILGVEALASLSAVPGKKVSSSALFNSYDDAHRKRTKHP